MAAVTDFVQQVFNALMNFAPPGIEPALFWGAFLLIFSVIFVTLAKVKVFGQDNQAVNAIIALVIAYFAASTTFTTVVLAKLFPNFSIAVVAILVFLIVMALVTGEEADLTDKWYVKVFAAIIVLWLVVTATFQLSGAGVNVPNVFSNWTATDWAIIVLAILVIGYFFKANTSLFGS